MAERAALPLIEEAHRLVDLTRKAIISGPPSEIGGDHLIAKLVLEHEAKLLDRDEKLRSRGVGLNFAAGTIQPDGMGMTDDDIGLYRAAISFLDDFTSAEFAKMRGGEALQLSLNRALEERGIVLHPDDPAWRQLELGFLNAKRKALGGIKARLAGEIVATPDPPEVTAGETLASATRRWAEGGGRAARKPRENSIAEAGRAVQRFIELHGDLDLRSITKAHARQYRDALAKVPKALPHALAKLPLPALLKKDLSKYAPRNAQTINKNLNLIAGILTKAEKDGCPSSDNLRQMAS